MPLIKCPDCGKMFSDSASACPSCGCPIQYALAEREKEGKEEQPQIVTPEEEIVDTQEVVEETSSTLEEPESGESLDVSQKVTGPFQKLSEKWDSSLSQWKKEVGEEWKNTSQKTKLIGASIVGAGLVIAVLFCRLHNDAKYYEDMDGKWPSLNYSPSAAVSNDNSSASVEVMASTSVITSEIPENEEYPDMSDEHIKACKDVLMAWDRGLKNHDLNSLSGLYADVVSYYRSNYTRDQIYQTQSTLISKNPEFSQYVDNIQPEVINDYTVKLHFDKHVRTSINGEYKTYPSYLVFSGCDDWRINAESDEVTNRNLERKWSKLAKIEVNNQTPLDKIFCPANVGKYLDTSYLSLTSDDGVEGPLVTAMHDSEEDGEICPYDMYGVLCKNYKGKSNTYYCNGYQTMGGCGYYSIWVYDANTGKLNVIRK